MLSYFHKNENDTRYYDEFIADRLPRVICDAHVHINLPGHVAGVGEEAIRGDWAAQCALYMPYEDAQAYYEALLPGVRVESIALPMPHAQADIPANNAYLADLDMQGTVRALMGVRPEWDVGYVQSRLLAGGFAGFKPYPYMASGIKGAEVSIFDFLPHHQLEIADKYARAVLLHLPRKGRLADPDNVREIREIVQRYQHIKLVIAHFGRCFNLKYFVEGMDQLGSDAQHLYFDTAAVINPAVHSEALQRLRTDQILYGTDMPILLWHGRRMWTQTEYINLCREDFPWNQHQFPQDEPGYTFFLYEQLKTMLDCLERSGASAQAAQDIFYNNARRVYAR